MTTSENTELYDLYVVSHESNSTEEDELIEFYKVYDKQTESMIQERIFQTPGYKLFIEEYDRWFKGDIIGPIDDKTVKLIRRALDLNNNNRSWVKPTGNRPIINREFETEISIRVYKRKFKRIKII